MGTIEQAIADMMWEPPEVEGRNHVWCPIDERMDPWRLGSLIDEGVEALLSGAAQVGVVMDLDTLRIEVAREGRFLVISAARVEAE